MSRRAGGDKGVLGRDCQQKLISAREDITQATVQWFAMFWQLFTTTTFLNTALRDFISVVMYSEITWA